MKNLKKKTKIDPARLLPVMRIKLFFYSVSAYIVQFYTGCSPGQCRKKCDITYSLYLPVTGKPSQYETNPDFAPTLHMGHQSSCVDGSKNKNKSMERFQRLNDRKKRSIN